MFSIKIKIVRTIKDNGKVVLRKIFEMFQKLDIDVLVHHFYSEIPNMAQLKKRRRLEKSA